MFQRDGSEMVDGKSSSIMIEGDDMVDDETDNDNGRRGDDGQPSTKKTRSKKISSNESKRWRMKIDEILVDGYNVKGDGRSKSVTFSPSDQMRLHLLSQFSHYIIKHQSVSDFIRYEMVVRYEMVDETNIIYIYSSHNLPSSLSFFRW